MKYPPSKHAANFPASVKLKKQVKTGPFGIKVEQIIHRKGGLGPYGFCEISQRVKSLNFFKNIPTFRVFDFAYDHKHNIVAISILKEKPSHRIAFGHDAIRRAFSMREADIVGGRLQRFDDGFFGASEWSGHYGDQWTDEIRAKFIKLMIQDLGLDIYHLPGIESNAHDVVGKTALQASQFELLEKQVNQDNSISEEFRQLLIKNYIEAGGMSQAEKHIKALMPERGQFNLKSAQFWRELGRLYHCVGNFQRAMFYLEMALHFFSVVWSPDSEAVAELCLILSGTAEELAKLDLAKSYVARANKIYYNMVEGDERVYGLVKSISVSARIARLENRFGVASKKLLLVEKLCKKFKNKAPLNQALEHLWFEQAALYGASMGQYGADVFSKILKRNETIRPGASYLNLAQVKLNVATSLAKRKDEACVKHFEEVLLLAERNYSSKVNPMAFKA